MHRKKKITKRLGTIALGSAMILGVGGMVLNTDFGMNLTVHAAELSKPASVTNVTLNTTAVRLGIGEKYQLIATVSTDESYAIQWKSSNSAVATVSAEGVVEAFSTGTATITVQINNELSATCSVTVEETAASLNLNKTALSLGKGESYQLRATVAPEAADQNVTWATTNENIVSVDESGMLTAVGIGTAEVKAVTVNGIEKSCKVTVKNAPSKVSLNKTVVSLGVGESYGVEAILPNGSAAAVRTFSSSDSSVVEMTNTNWKGEFKAVNPGTAWVTVKLYNGEEASCKVVVKNAPSKVSLSKSVVSLGVGESYKLEAILPSSSAAAKRVFSSSDDSVVKMTKTNWKGEFKAEKVGTAWVNVKLYNGQTASCKVVVKNAPSKVSLKKTSLSLGVGESYKLEAILPSGSAAAKRVFSSSNNSVVKMTKTNWTGEFKAVKPGTAYVTVKLYNGQTASCKVTVKKAPSTVKMSRRTLVLEVGKTATLSAVLPSDSASSVRTFRSNDSSIVKMLKTNWTGEIKALKPGTAYVTVKLYNGKQSTCKVDVYTSKTMKVKTGSSLLSDARWSSNILDSVPSGSTVNVIGSSGHWYKVRYKNNAGWMYNLAFGSYKNYSTIDTSTIDEIADDIIFNTGKNNLRGLYNYVYRMSYTGAARNDTLENLVVYILRYRRGACYNKAALLYYLMDRAGYEAVRITDGIDRYTGGGPHNWCMVKMNGVWRHIDATPVTGLPMFYLSRDKDLSPYFTWDRTKYPRA